MLAPLDRSLKRAKALAKEVLYPFSGAARRAMAGRVVLITGATDGIGRAAARRFVECGASVLVHGRARHRVMQVVQALEHELRQHRFRELQPSVHGYVAELSEFDQVRAMIERIAAEHPRLDGLVNNAALGNEPDRRLNSDGVERVWAVNVVAPCLLVDGLAPLMMRSRDARVVNMASGALAPLDDDLNLETRYDPSLAYCRSKQGLTVLTAALAEALSADRIAVNALDPGTVPTKMAASFGMVDAIGSLRHAAASIGRLLASPSLAGTTGGFFACGRPVSPPAQAQDPEFRAWLLQRVRETYRVR